jgi:hypothetical protein
MCARLPPGCGKECLRQAKGEAGLDHYQVRSWRAWGHRTAWPFVAEGR